MGWIYIAAMYFISKYPNEKNNLAWEIIHEEMQYIFDNGVSRYGTKDDAIETLERLETERTERVFCLVDEEGA